MFKKLILILTVIFLVAGCSGGKKSIPKPGNNNGVITIPYQKPLDFKQYEVYVSLTDGFTPTGWDPATPTAEYDNEGSWAGTPNAVADWDGAANTLHTITTTEPIQVTNLTPGKTYYFCVVVVDRSNKRSKPGPIRAAVAGDAQRSSTVVIAASNASPASKAGADYVCTGSSDQTVINQAMLDAVAANPGTIVTIKLTSGNYILSNSIAIPSRVTFDCDGTIQADPSVTTAFAAVKNTPSGGSQDIKITDLTIAGSQYMAEMAFINLANSSLDNITVNSSYSGGFKIRLETCRVTIERSKLTKTEISLLGCTQCTISNNQITQSASRGVYLDYSHNNNIDGNKVTENAHYGIFLNRSSGNIVNNNQVVDNGQSGILINSLDDGFGDNNLITSNYVEGNGTLTNDVYDGISVVGYCSNNSIQNNTCRKGDNTNKPNSGIFVASADAKRNLISNNDCYQSGVSYGIHDGGTNTNFGSGNRNNDGTWSTTPN